MLIHDDLIKSLFINPHVQINNSSKYWDKIITCSVENLKDLTETFCSANEQLDQDTINAFGTSRPGADKYLLHFAPGWKSNPNQNPVILIHGAGLDATSFTNLYNLGFEGIQQQLVSLGYRVFALTFSHSHGDNFIQAEQLADAILRVKNLCKVQKVDIVAHSKGGVATRIYISNMSTTPYRGDVRKYIMLGTPNLGVDFAFRNPALSYPIYLSESNGVIAWDKMNCLNIMIDTADRAIYADGTFPGQSQMLHRWDDQYPLDITQPDWWTTYYGGSGFVSHSRGIEIAIADGGDLIAKLEKKAIEPEIEISVLAGDNHMFGLIPGESAGSSDGLVFVDSVFNTDAMLSKGAKLSVKTTLQVNHMELLFSPQVVHWVSQQLE
ncbi:MAG: alpha/beta fold hydrolase [Syntrophomonas sp.]|nr:alpha/beta fold hydrolase [Syntrophomonas sp.]